MKKKFFKLSFITLFFLAACNNSNDSTTDRGNQNSIEKDTVEVKPPADSITIWKFDADKDVPVPAGVQYFDTLSAQNIVSGLSRENILIDFIKQSHDTIFVRIKDSEYLTQRIGTSGARDFLSVATFTITELKGIRYVNFDFMEGDHAVPGTYHREKFLPHQQ